MRALSLKTRLWLGQVMVLAVMLALAAFGADWALRLMVLGRVDDQILALARAEAAALEDHPPPPLRLLEIAPDPPAAGRLNKLVQVTDLDGQIVAQSATIGSARLPTPPDLLARLRGRQTVFDTVT
ncbi:MAG: two-component sensor histidine kinase, partial [Candidatus Rokuibacteriota bacterium]